MFGMAGADAVQQIKGISADEFHNIIIQEQFWSIFIQIENIHCQLQCFQFFDTPGHMVVLLFIFVVSSNHQGSLFGVCKMLLCLHL